MAQLRASTTVQQKGEEGLSGITLRSQFSLVEDGGSVRNLEKPKPNQQWLLVDKCGSEKTWNGVGCNRSQIPLHEVREEQTEDEDARPM